MIKKQLVSILFALCMVLCLVPLAAFAEGETENVQVVADQTTLVAAMADTSVTTVKLAADIDIDATLKVDRTVTLDLNGQVLKYVGESKGSVIVVEDGGNLTLMDSNDEKVHNFDKSVMPWALAADDATGENIVAVPGGVITGGTGHPYQLYSTVNCGGGVYIAPGGQLTMTGGNIIGCSAKYGGGVCIYPKQDSKQGQFSMSGGSIIGCSAESGGGVCAFGKFQMSGQAVIRSCTAEGTSFYFGGGVWVDGSFEMSGEAIIEGCQAISEYAYGGGVYVNSSSSFVMSGKAKIERCQAISTPSSPSKGGGVHLANNTTLTLSGSAVIQNCTATNSANSGEAYGGGVSAACVKEITLADSARIVGCAAANGSGLYITGSQVPGYGILHANGGSVDGDVVLGDTEDGPSTITGSGGTVFNGKVTVTPGSTIESGKFNGEVINNGTINGGVFTGIVSGNGTINGGTFNTPMTGSGTETDPYQISTADQLKLFRDIVNGAGGQTQNRGAYAVLTANIDLNNEAWTPIGNYTEGNQIYYEGTFDGGGYTISGLNVTGKFRCASLFGAVKGGTIKNLTVAGNVSHNYSSTGLDCHVGGIVGSALDAATIENCSNHCSVTGGSGDFIGGIAGSNINNARIIDCYNVGTITGTIIETGGVTGFNMGTISNCYNVGTIKMLHNSNAVGEIVGNNVGTVKNCYYLAGTNLNAVGQSNNGSITKTESKTAADFANDTVLALLKADRDNSPWDSCQYVATAKITLPVFNGQGDAHDHQSSDWESNETEHWQVCTCGAVFHKAEHSGGTATCTQRAKCAVCGAEYGDVLGHDFTTSWTHDDNEHWKQCSHCDKKDDVSPHTWDNGTITIAPTCTKAGERTYTCTECGATKTEPIDATGHSWKSDWTSDATHHWHECANESCDVTDNAGKNGYAEHSGGKATCTQNAVCEICKESYGSLDPNNHTDLKHIDAKAATAAEEGNIAYWYCDGCKKYFSDKDGTKEIAKADTVTAKLPPKITAGDGAAVTQGEKKELSFTSDAPFADFVRVELDGTALEEKNYTKREGSTIITLNRDFVAALSVGEHTLAIVSQHGTATAKFTVKAKPTETATPQPTVTPQPTAQPVSPILRTGDTANPALWFALLIVSGGAAIGITVVSRKKKHNK